MADCWDLLMPGGKPIGRAGSRAKVREITGATLADAEELFQKLAAGGKAVSGSTHAGQLVELPTGGFVGFRIAAKSPGTIATIDVDIPGLPIKKIKFQS